MPEYPYVSIDDPEVKCYFFYTMRDVPRGDIIITDDQGCKWRRIFEAPQAAFNTVPLDPYSPSDFNRRLSNKNHTIGQLFDDSKELSEKRASKDGVDPVKKKYYDKYFEERKGRIHPNQQKELFNKKVSDTNAKMKDLGITIKTNS